MTARKASDLAEGNPVIVSLTTIPSRVAYLHRTLPSLFAQTAVPDAIFLHVPRVSAKEPQRAYDPLPGVCSHPLVVVNRVEEDLGPITKLAPALSLGLPPETRIVVVDDDRCYAPDLIECLLQASQRHPADAVGFSGWTVGRTPFESVGLSQCVNKHAHPDGILVDFLQGTDGYLVKRRFFGSERQLLEDARVGPTKIARMMDDITIGAYLDRMRIRRRVVWRAAIPITVRDMEVERTNPISSGWTMGCKVLAMMFYNRLFRHRFHAPQGAPLHMRFGLQGFAALVLLLTAAIVGGGLLFSAARGC